MLSIERSLSRDIFTSVPHLNGKNNVFKGDEQQQIEVGSVFDIEGLTVLKRKTDVRRCEPIPSSSKVLVNYQQNKNQWKKHNN